MALRFAIIGCGNIAGRHAAAIRHTGTLEAVCDEDKTKASDFANQTGSRAYSDLSLLFQNEKIDIAVICTPNGLHPAHTIAALKAGCHVLCEKPLAINSEQARLMQEQATRLNRKLFVVKQNRFNPLVQALKQMLNNHKLGNIHSFQINCFWNRPAIYYNRSWRGTTALDGGILFTQFSHFIDLLYWFLGDIEHVSGWRGNFSHRNTIEFEDAGVANVIMKNGIIGNIHYTINAHAQNMEGSVTLFGSKGTVKIGGEYLNRLIHFSVENEEEPDIKEFYPSPSANHQRVYEEMIRSLNEHPNESVDGREAIKSIEMIEQIYRSSPFISGHQP